jgi:SAM-dependent methyltransferase
MFNRTAELYDAFYREKDYRAEACYVADVIRARAPRAATLLDIACGTGEHARFLAVDHAFSVDGTDIEPGLLEIATTKLPVATFHVADMVDFELGRRYDAVVCLFSSIGYVRTEQALRRALEAMARHLVPGGVLVVEPWFEPGTMTHGLVTLLSSELPDGTKACRMSHTTVEGRLSRLRFEYLIGDADGLKRETEVHELGLFSRDEMTAALDEAGLRDIAYDEPGPSGRGLYLAMRPG